jgi:Protein of unknown function (DUF1501)
VAFHPAHVRHPAVTRREFLTRAGGLSMLALTGMLEREGLLAASPSTSLNPLALRASHLPARAKAVIWLYMYGGPCGFDLFDPKPEINKRNGQPYPGGKLDVFFGNPGPIMRSPFAFKRHGRCGAWVAEVFPHLARCVDDIAFLKACTADSNNHGPAVLQMNTGMVRLGYPSAGSWVTYGLGSANRNLPGYIVMHDPRSVVVGGPPNWGSAFLPAAYQGVVFRPGKNPILYLDRPTDSTPARQRAQLDLLKEWNDNHRQTHPGEADLLGRIESFELAYRMQMEAPEVVDLSAETEETRRLYGLDEPRCQAFGTQLLLARRLVEKGVRFIQIYSGGTRLNWDAHQDLEDNHRRLCTETDQPIAGLLTDLKRRGLLDSTLVIWGTEFGRMPVSQDGNGRDHNPEGFLMWLAGGGVKPGISYGATDELGHRAVEKPVSVHDFHATVLHLLGLDHKRLTYAHNGRSFRLTDVHGTVVKDILG